MVQKRAISLGLAILMLCFSIPVVRADAALDNETKTGSSIDSSSYAFWELPTYSEYISQYKQIPFATETVTVSATEFIKTEGDGFKVLENPSISDHSLLYTPTAGFVEFEVAVPQTALYALVVEGMPAEGNQSAVERRIYIDGLVPFQEALTFTAERIWRDSEPFGTDRQGNDMTPAIEEVERLSYASLTDKTGLYNGELCIYLEAGVHTIRLEAEKEPYIIKNIILCPSKSYPSYASVKSEYEKANYLPADLDGTDFPKAQAEHPTEKSDYLLYASADRTSTANQPFSSSVSKLNVISGSQWNTNGQWLSWKFTPEKTGLYRIITRYKPQSEEGMYVSRSLYINGEIPFEEASGIRFGGDSEWQVAALGDSENGEYEFYFEGGKTYEIKLEATIGEFSETIRLAQEIIDSLLTDCQEIMMTTGVTLDKYRDYHFDVLIPDVLADFNVQLEALRSVYESVVSETGGKGRQTAVMDGLLLDLESICSDPEQIATRLDSLRSNLGSFSSFTQSARSQPLTIDWIGLLPKDTKLPKAQNGFFAELLSGIRAFINSFATDYYTFSDDGGKARNIKVWLGAEAGRDQAQLIRRMASDSFTPESGVGVTMQIVSGGTLLPATLAGVGPDVYLQTDSTTPLNLAFRNAVADLSGFEDFDEVASRFDSAALVPFQFRGKTYALPDTFSFLMMFCRLDILSDLGLEVPTTWDDFMLLIPELTKQNMTVGIPSSMDTYAMLLYQNGQELYKDEGRRVAFDTKTAYAQFERFTDFFSQYSLPLSFSFENRFRNGEMPIGIASFATCNMLRVFAPEIQGCWSFFPVPGTLDENGELNSTTVGTSTGSMIMQDCSDKDAAWEFLRWWTDAPTQLRYSREIEGILGPSGRYSTANIEAFSQLDWTSSELKGISNQRQTVRGVPQVPGGYMTSRYFSFAFYDVVNNGQNPYEQLRSYTVLINEEIEDKHKEFKLDY